MKRAILTSVLFCSVAMFGQIHGVPASVTSVGPNGIGSGPAASVTSLGPRGYSCTYCANHDFIPTINFRTGTVTMGGHFNGNGNRRDGQHPHHNGNRYVGGGYLYPYPYPVAVVPQEDVEPQPPADAEEQGPTGPPQTIYDRRPVPYQPPVGEGRYFAPREAPAQAQSEPLAQLPAKPVAEPLPIVVVFKDGHQQEIKNYAIVGDTLYELGGLTSHKIKLADLDLKATSDRNEERGVDFTVPANLKPKA